MRTCAHGDGNRIQKDCIPQVTSEAWDCLETYGTGSGVVQFHGSALVFAHQQLQEYFGALWLRYHAEQSGLDFEVLRPFLVQPAWDEPIYLLAGTDVRTARALG